MQMENEIKQIIEKAKRLKANKVPDLDIAKYVHIELGKLIIYDNNYTTKNDGFDIDRDIEGKISKNSIKRQQKILSSETSIKNTEQVCKGMAEIYAAILSEIGINVNVVGVNSKEEVEGEKREDGSTIHVPETYKCFFDKDMRIKIENKQINNNTSPSHYYCVVHTENGEYIQDYLTEQALTRIKIGEADIQAEQIAGFHLKQEHRERALNSNSILNRSFRDEILKEYQNFCQNNNDKNRIFDFVFGKLREYISYFGFEEAKDFISLVSKSLPKGEIVQIPININLVREDEQCCDICCIYQYNGKNYLVRSGKTSSKFPIGEISKETIQDILNDGFEPRKMSDSKKIKDLMSKQTISMQAVVKNAINNAKIGMEQVNACDKFEYREILGKEVEGETIDEQ